MAEDLIGDHLQFVFQLGRDDLLVGIGWRLLELNVFREVLVEFEVGEDLFFESLGVDVDVGDIVQGRSGKLKGHFHKLLDDEVFVVELQLVWLFFGFLIHN